MSHLPSRARLGRVLSRPAFFEHCSTLVLKKTVELRSTGQVGHLPYVVRGIQEPRSEVRRPRSDARFFIAFAFPFRVD